MQDFITNRFCLSLKCEKKCKMDLDLSDCSGNWNKSDSLHGILLITLQILQLKLQLFVRLYFDRHDSFQLVMRKL